MPQRIGVQAIVDTSQLQAGVNAYLSALNRMVSATQGAARGLTFGGAASGLAAASQGMGGFGNAITAVSGHVVTLNSQINNLAGTASQANNSFVGLQAGIGAALGTAAIQAVQALGGAMRALSDEIIEQVGFWERLAISVNFFSAIDMQAENPTMAFNEALQQTQEEAQGTLLWLQQLSILSPFTAQQVGQIYRIGQAMGLTKDQADAVIQPLLDMGSAAGLSADVLERISIALGQVETRAKLTGEEIRQFANAGVPIKRIMMEALDLTASGFDDALEGGELLSGVVLPEVVKWMRQFQGAAEEVSKTTITGLLSSLSEIRELGLAKFFGAATEQVREQLRQLVEFLTQPEVFVALETIGRDLGQAVSQALAGITNAIMGMVNAWIALDPVIKQGIFVFAGGVIALTAFAGAVGLVSAALSVLINPFTLVVTAVAGFAAAWSTNWGGIASTTQTAVDAVGGALAAASDLLSDLVSNLADASSSALEVFSDTLSAAAEWGANIVTAFSEGILATVSVVIDALMVMGEAMAFMLAPGSPPRLLPDLDKWGTEAANVYLRAWTDADFGILDKITGEMKKVLKGAVLSGAIEEGDIPSIVLGSGNNLAEAINQIRRFGIVAQDTLNEVIRTTGQAAEQVVGYLIRYTGLANATKQVESAQNALNNAVTHYTDLLAPLQRRLTEITRLQEKNTDSKEIKRLTRITVSRYATEAARQMALLKIEEIRTKAKIAAAETERDAVVGGAEQQLTAAEQAQAQAQKEIDLFQKRVAAQTQQYDLMLEIEKINNRNDKSASERVKKAKKELTPLEKQLKILKLQQAELSDMIEAYRARRTLADEEATAAQKLAATMKLQEVSLNQQTRDVEALELGYSGVFDEIRKIQVVLADIEKPKKGKKENPLAGMATDLGSQSDKIKKAFEANSKAMEEFQKKWNDTKAAIGETITTINESLPPFLRLTDAAGQASPLLQTLAKAFAGITAILVGGKLIAAVRALAPAFAALGGAGTLAVVAVTALAVAWSQNWFDIQTVTADAVTFIQEQLQSFIDTAGLGFILDALDQFVRDVQTVWSLLPFYQDMPNIFWSSLRALFRNLQQFFGDLQAYIAQAGPILRKKFTDEWLPGFVTWAQQVTPMVLAELESLLRSVLGFLQGLAARILDVAITKLLPALTGFAAGAASLILPALAKLGSTILTWVTDLGSEVATKLGQELFKAFSTGAFGGVSLALGIDTSSIEAASESIKGIMDNVGAKVAAAAIVITSSVKALQFALTNAGTVAEGAFRGVLTVLRLVADAHANLAQVVIERFRAIAVGIGTFLRNPLAGLRQIVFGVLTLFEAMGTRIKSVIAVASAAFRVLAGGPIKVVVAAITGLLRLTTSLSESFKILSMGIKAAMDGVRLGLLSTQSALRLLIDLTFAAVRNINLFDGAKAVLGGLATAVRGFGGVLRSTFAALPGIVSNLVAGLGNIGKLGGGALSGLASALSKGFGSIRGIIGGVGGAVRGLLTPTNLVGLAIGFIIDQITENWSAIQGFFGDLGGFISELGALFTPEMFGGFQAAMGGLLSGTEEGMLKFQAFFMSIYNYLVSWTGRVGNWFMTEVLPAFVGWAINLPSELGQYIVETFQAIGSIITVGVGLVQQYVMPLVGAFTSWLVEAWPAISGYLGQIWNDFSNWIAVTASDLLNKMVTEWIPAFVGWLGDVLPPLLTGLGALALSVVSWIATTAGTLTNRLVTEWIPAFVDWVGEVWPGVSQKLGEWWLMMSTYLSNTAGMLVEKFTTEWIPAFTKWIGEAVPPLLAKLGEWGLALINWILNVGLPELLVAVLNLATALVDWVGQAIAFIVPKLGEFIGAILNWIISDGVPLLVKGVVGLAAALYGWISGSSEIEKGDSAWGKVGAAFQSFIGKIGEVITNDVLPAIVKFAAEVVSGFITGLMELFSPTNVKNFADAAVKLGGDIMAGIGQGIKDKANEIDTAFADAVLGLIGAGKDAAEIQSPSKVAADEIGAPIAEGINKGITETPLDALAKAIAEQIVAALESTRQNTTAIMAQTAAETLPIATAFTVSMTTLFAGMTTAIYGGLQLWQQLIILLFNEVALNISTILTASAATQATAWTGITQTTTTAVTTMKDAVEKAFADMAEAVAKTLTGLTETVWKVLGDKSPGLIWKLNEDFVPAGKEIGKDFVDGISDGIEGEVDSLIETIEAMIDGALDAAQDALAAASPSKETRDLIGKPFVQGIAVGIADGTGDVADQVNQLVDASMDADSAGVGKTLGERIIAGLQGSLNSISVAADLVGNLLTVKAYSIGQSIGEQIAAGINASASAITSAVGFVVNGAMASQMQLASTNLVPAQAQSGVGTINNYYYNRNYNLTLNTSEDSGGIVRDFNMMEIMAL